MTSPPTDDPSPAPHFRKNDADLLRTAQSILFTQERERIRALEEEVGARQNAEAEIASLKEQIDRLEAKLNAAERAYEDKVLDLQTNVSILNYKNFGKSESLLSRLAPVFSRLIGQRIEEDRDEMAKAFSPIMGQAIRTQIRNSRQDMIDALYPIIGSLVQKSVTETLREIQRNIDARLRQTSHTLMRSLRARSRGVSQSELTLRDALPFSVRQLFLIQHGTGLVLASYPSDETELSSGMIGGMLTAIREFARDSFGRGDDDTDLDEIQYGNERIIIRSGQHAYLAVVIDGVEPGGFHAQLREFISELHVQHDTELYDYDGDPDTLPPLQPKLAQLTDSLTAGRKKEPNALSRAQKLIALFVGLGGILLLATACFYLQFTIALLPIAFPGPTSTVTMAATSTPTSLPTVTQMPLPTMTAAPTLPPTATATQTHTPTPSPTSTPEHTPTNTASPTITLTPSVTPTPISAAMIGHVYTSSEPGGGTLQTDLVFRGTAVIITAVYDNWANIQWTYSDGVHHGWVLLKWIDLREPVPNYLITPTVVN